MRQYSGFGSAAETNQRFHFLLGAGQTGLSCAFDLPTQMGYDSDHPRSEGEVGKVGVAIDSLEDMELLLHGLPLDTVTTSMTINSTAAILLCLYELVAEGQGVSSRQIGGTIQNDLLKEYVARGTYIYPPRQSMRIITDIFAYCRDNVPKWNTISVSGYHIREAGSTAVQEIAFTLSNGIAYVQAAIDAGLDVDEFAPRLSFFWNGHNDFFEEVAKFRASRRMWYRIMAERFGAKSEKSKLLRFHTQTAGSMLTAQQPENNIVRVSLQALGGGDRRDAEPAHQRVRRGPRAADRAGGDDRAADPADHRVRVGRHRHARTRWRARTSWSPSPTRSRPAPGSTSRRSTRWAARSRRSKPATCRTRSSGPRSSGRPRSTRRRRSSSASTATRPTRTRSRTSSRSTRSSSASRPPGSGRSGPSVTTPP